MTTATHAVTVRRLIEAPRPRVFDAFRRPDALVQWFSPSPAVSVEVLAFHFALAGTFRLRYVMPDGQRKFVEGVYERITPPEELAFSWIWAAPDPHAGIETRVRVCFLEQGDATEVVLTHDRWPDQAAGDRHAEGWQGTLDRLARWLADAPTASLSTGDRHHA